MNDFPKARPQTPCIHGHGSMCECQLPVYEGLFIIPMVFEDGIKRHIAVKAQDAYDGGMRKFTDPKTGEVIGSCGVKFWEENAVKLESFTDQI